MTSTPGIARRVARLENDRDALNELVDEFRAESLARFDRLESTLAEVLRRLPETL
jgi:hypothetical protein